MLKGFRQFLMRGNVIDLAIAVVVGTAFTALISVVTRSLLQPLIGLFLGGGVDGGKLTFHGQVFDFAAVINALLTFLIIAATVYFFVVVPMRRLKKPAAHEEVDENETELLADIRDLLAHQQQQLQRSLEQPAR